MSRPQFLLLFFTSELNPRKMYRGSMKNFLAMSLLQETLGMNVIIETADFNMTYVRLLKNAYELNWVNFLTERVLSFVHNQASSVSHCINDHRIKDLYHIAGRDSTGRRLSIMPECKVDVVFGQITFEESSHNLLSVYTASSYHDWQGGPSKSYFVTLLIYTVHKPPNG